MPEFSRLFTSTISSACPGIASFAAAVCTKPPKVEICLISASGLPSSAWSSSIGSKYVAYAYQFSPMSAVGPDPPPPTALVEGIVADAALAMLAPMPT